MEAAPVLAEAPHPPAVRTWLPADQHGADPGVGVGRADPGGPNRGSESRRSDSLRI